MTVEIGIAAYSDDEDIIFGDSKIRHINCEKAECPEMTIKRDSINNFFTLECDCDLKIEFEQFGEAEDTISKCAIDQITATLPTGTYSSSPEGPVVVSIWGDTSA